jgi:hypothetical protein
VLLRRSPDASGGASSTKDWFEALSVEAVECSIAEMNARILVIGILALAPFASAQEKSNFAKARPLWKIDLKPFGFRKANHGIINDPGSSVSIAATDSVIAVAFPSPPVQSSPRPAQWVVLLPRLEDGCCYL